MGCPFENAAKTEPAPTMTSAKAPSISPSAFFHQPLSMWRPRSGKERALFMDFYTARRILLSRLGDVARVPAVEPLDELDVQLLRLPRHVRVHEVREELRHVRRDLRHGMAS